MLAGHGGGDPKGCGAGQGVGIHDKHIEVIVRQMLKRVTIIESGDAELLPGELVERTRFENGNRRVVADVALSASGRPELMGLTKRASRVEVIAYAKKQSGN